MAPRRRTSLWNVHSKPAGIAHGHGGRADRGTGGGSTDCARCGRWRRRRPLHGCERALARRKQAATASKPAAEHSERNKRLQAQLEAAQKQIESHAPQLQELEQLRAQPAAAAVAPAAAPGDLAEQLEKSAVSVSLKVTLFSSSFADSSTNPTCVRLDHPR